MQKQVNPFLKMKLQVLGKEIKQLVLEQLRQYNLQDAEFVSSLREEEATDLVSILAADYVKYIISGRKPGKFPPADAIIKWCNEHNIPADNSTVFLISRKIALDGITPRDFIPSSKIDEAVSDYIDKIIDEVWNI